MSKLFKDYRSAIQDYCADNGLCFDKLRTSPSCYNDETLFFLYHDPKKRARGLFEDTPSPATLEIYLENGKLRFVQTDITHKYLGAGRETQPEPARATAAPAYAAPRARRGEPAMA